MGYFPRLVLPATLPVSIGEGEDCYLQIAIFYMYVQVCGLKQSSTCMCKSVV